MIAETTDMERTIFLIEAEVGLHKIGPSEGRFKDCVCGDWTGTMGALAGYRDHVVKAVIDRLRRSA